ncbi:transcription factor UPBEAT1-like [Quillaja saponaria]|uniref:Transcription factor UPBEAT1-like n=1 Tax=Quillaja saponaria TaxID=32244 RepID=A0AAD7QA71_QUISA|nr:transcription factor UPBEAT1-like [Quillaja saponaria]
MGISQQSLFVSLDLKELLSQGSTEENSNSYMSLRRKVLAARNKRWRQAGIKRPVGILMKRRRARLEGSGRCCGTTYRIERKVRTLKRLIFNSDESIGLDGVFRETADYILSLQMRVRVMQIMVKVLSGSNDDQ